MFPALEVPLLPELRIFSRGCSLYTYRSEWSFRKRLKPAESKDVETPFGHFLDHPVVNDGANRRETRKAGGTRLVEGDGGRHRLPSIL